MLTLDFPTDISPVHSISLVLTDKQGKKVGSNFYWRSNDPYQGANTVTGPCVSGFEPLQDMPSAKVKSNAKIRRAGDKIFFDITLRNTSSKIAFFNRLQLTDTEGRPVRPSFYSDNYFTLLPGESTSVTIETTSADAPNNMDIKISGWNTPSKTYLFSKKNNF